ncbi:hypothetical protein [Fischerella sp. NIES-3754]|nr:hypothetical protein [Fischerella sp. NIES-3754]
MLLFILLTLPPTPHTPPLREAATRLHTPPPPHRYYAILAVLAQRQGI